jgi:anti-anti-sigma regulatory factor
VTLRIEWDSDRVVLRLIGRVESDHVGELREQVRAHQAKILFDLEEVTLVDVSAVRFFVTCEADGVQLLNCPPYVRAWMEREGSPATRKQGEETCP